VKLLNTVHLLHYFYTHTHAKTGIPEFTVWLDQFWARGGDGGSITEAKQWQGEHLPLCSALLHTQHLYNFHLIRKKTHYA